MKRKKRNKYFKIDKNVLKKLEKAGVPSHIIEALRSMLNERYESESRFSGALSSVTGIAAYVKHESALIKCCTKYSPKTQKKKDVNLPNYQLEQSGKHEITANGGMFLLAELIKKTEMIESFNSMGIFLRQKITEAVHILTLVMNQLSGGEVIFDTRYLDKDEALKTIFGSIHIPASHTSGDFLERFTDVYVEKLRKIIHKMQDKMLRKLRKKLGSEVSVSLDSTIYEIFGNTIENSSMSYKRIFGYHPLLMHIQNTGEMLDIYLREGNAYTSTQAVDMIEHNIPRLAKYFDKIVLLCDSGFFDQKIVVALEKLQERLNELSQKTGRKIEIKYIITAVFNNPLKEKVKTGALNWVKPEKKSEKEGIKHRNSNTTNYRLKNLRENLRKHHKNLKIRGDVELADFKHTVASWGFESRFVFKRQEITIENLTNQLEWIEPDDYFYHGYVTNIEEEDASAQKITEMIDGRGHQEKFIEDFKNGLSTTHIPTKHFYGNYAYFLISMLSWNLKCWLLYIIEPDQIMRWKRFRFLFVKVGVQVIKSGRYIKIRFGKGFKRFDEFLEIFEKIRNFNFETC